MTADIAVLPRLTAEVEWTAGTWTDMTSRLNLSAGINVTGLGRQDEYSQSTPARMTCTLDNLDGALSPDNTASPFYPNVVPGKRLRIRSREPNTLGNMLTNGAFASDVSGWSAVVFFGAALATSWVVPPGLLVAPGPAAKCLQVTLSPNANDLCLVTPTLATPLVVGRAYELVAVVAAPSGSSVWLGDPFGLYTTSTATGAWQTLRLRFTATSSSLGTFRVVVKGPGGTTYAYVGAARLDDVQTTGPAVTAGVDGDTVVQARYRDVAAGLATVYVDEWPMGWDGSYAFVGVSGADRLAGLGDRSALRSCVEQAILAPGPIGYWTLGDADRSVSASESSGRGSGALVVRDSGAGASIQWAKGTGNGVDGLSCPVFPVGGSVYLSGPVAGASAYAVTLRASISGVVSGATSDQLVATAWDDWSSMLAIRVTPAGKVSVTDQRAFAGTVGTVTSAASVTDGRTHDLVATLSVSGSTTTLRLYVDGASAGSVTYTATYWVPVYAMVSVGGSPSGLLLTGSVSHVAIYPSAISAAAAADQWLAMTTGYAGDSSAARVARIADWVGIPASERQLDAPATTDMTIADIAGQSPLAAMQAAAAAEQGLLFVDGEGDLVLYSRTRQWSWSAVSIDAEQFGPDVRITKGLIGVVNDITGTRRPQGDLRAVDDASVAAYGPIKVSMDLQVRDDLMLRDILQAILRTRSQPQLRLPSAALDGLTDPTYAPTIRALRLWSRIAITSLPSQVASKLTVMVQGLSMAITADSWTVTFSSSPTASFLPFTPDRNGFDTLDGSPVLVY